MQMLEENLAKLTNHLSLLVSTQEPSRPALKEEPENIDI
jgi:hypothetical protein